MCIPAPSDSGTSRDPCSLVYPGISPNSEIEVQNVQKEIMRLKDRLKAFVTIHTAAKMVLTPWGSVLDPGPEEKCEYLPEPHSSKVVSTLINFTLNDHFTIPCLSQRTDAFDFAIINIYSKEWLTLWGKL